MATNELLSQFFFVTVKVNMNAAISQFIFITMPRVVQIKCAVWFLLRFIFLHATNLTFCDYLMHFTHTHAFIHMLFSLKLSIYCVCVLVQILNNKKSSS